VAEYGGSLGVEGTDFDGEGNAGAIGEAMGGDGWGD